ncbi:MAG: class I SAM-dependent methyltransferase, partial [Desulfuromonadaceae bacterium]|nr:class I SAM-dependent methyltransferase [Desulfuromonadaceae bacterium]
MLCKICAGFTDSFAHARLLGKNDVEYYQCRSCGYICTEEPYWLEEAYSAAITGSDVGLVRRNSRLATITRVVLSVCFNKTGRFLDFAGGYGLLVRMMRDSGFDFHWYDRYCTNLFASTFVADLDASSHYELITAFEVLEHLVDPLGGLYQMLKFSRNILFTTNILPDPAPKPNNWWYYALEHGQHVSFYSR